MLRFLPVRSVLCISIGVTSAGCRSDADKDQPSAAGKAEPAKAGRGSSPAEVAPGDAHGSDTTGAAWTWNVPKGLGQPPVVPDDNPMTTAKVELGHQLFMDKRLSVDGTRSCYSCHQNHLGNADGRATALGPGGKPLPRNTPTIWNVGYQPVLYWDGRAADLEAQGIGALKGGNMGLGDGLEAKMQEIGALPEYKAAFAEVFELGEADAVTSEHVTKALSAYERTLLCGDTAFDRQELDEAAERGQALFMSKASCVTCHNGPAFSDGLPHFTGVAIDPSKADADIGMAAISKNDADKFKFRTPTLRNVSRTAPYFHDGSVAELEDAVRTMAGGGTRHAGLTHDPLLLDRKLTDDEIADLVAFLKGLDCPGELEVIGEQTAEGIAAPPA